MGRYIAASFPGTDWAARLIHTAMHTRKLHSTPRSSAVRNGRPALAAAVATTDSYTPSKVPAATVRAATDPAPSTLARYTTPQLRSIRPHVSCRSSSGITSWGRYYTKSVTLYNAEGEKETVSLVAAADESQMTEYFTFRTRQGHKAIAFDDSSVILTEKTAEKLGLSVGDSFEVETTDGGRRSLTLTGITENYVFTRLYLSQAQLKTLNGGALPAWNAVYGQTDCPTDTARASLSSSILACNYVSSVSFIEDTTQMFDGLIGCLNYVVMLVIVCAAALAAVVLYNLISVNLGERKKELATIKVLGFYDKEVYRYIFREIDLLSLIGSLVGLVVGIPLHQFIIRTVEMDQMMFIRSIAPRSFVFSVALTMLFNFAVCLLMRRHVRQISMVESMKAPE